MSPPPSRGDRPRILVTRAEDVTDERWADYADRITSAGGTPIEMSLADWHHGAVPPEHDGLLLTGGVDIDPAVYGERRSERVTDVNRARDDFELALLRAALDRDVPVLGVCRGHQLFNVAHGGTLLQHIEEREPHRSRRGADGTIESGWHDVDVRPGTLLASALGVRRARANSRHHQAVTPERLAPGLEVAATTEDGIVEALVAPSKRWAVSVQWHPERTEVGGTFDGLFLAFVEACAAVRGTPAYAEDPAPAHPEPVEW
ncbi:MAG: gamma-glutamyl-gamma-aminobutyrate hydrolase family protein [Dehalococcoidia bacterium]|nr:gamma-glutamyl-gamma-aminobutyrate hydrolase family protein [Dehalococcoidia bacterium]